METEPPTYKVPCAVCGETIAFPVPKTAYCPKHDPNKLRLVIGDVVGEFRTATSKFPPFNSAHEGFAVLKEEVDELWEEVKGNKKDGALNRMRLEATQVAAMAI